MGCCLTNKSSPKPLSGSIYTFSSSKFITVHQHSILRDYIILKLLGEGATGQVKLVNHRETHTKRALKTINIPPGSSVSLVMGEVEIMKQLDHPNILRIIEVYEEKHRVHFIMEYCSGGELFEKISTFKSFSENQAAKYMYDILSALLYMHNKGLVHRDIKPENILVDDTSEDSVLKIADFGGAAWLKDSSFFRQSAGTMYYTAPEVLNHNYNEKCDVWSAGVILYILLAGYPPFRGKDEDETNEQIKFSKLRFSHSIWRIISKEAKNLVRKMLEKNPKDRPSVAEVIRSQWVQRRTKQDIALHEDCLRNIKAYHIQNKLQKVTLGYIVSQMLSHQEESQARNLFRELDENGDGMLSLGELEKGLSRLDLDVNELFVRLDVDHSGYLNYTEFLTAAVDWERALSEDHLREAFNIYDYDRDGQISFEELKTILQGVSGDDEYYRGLIREMDADGDGTISMEEFIMYMGKHASTPANRI